MFLFVLSFLCVCCCLLAVLAVVFWPFLLLSFGRFGCCLLAVVAVVLLAVLAVVFWLFLLLSICRFAVVFWLFGFLLSQTDCGCRVSKVSPDVTAPAGLP